jgi:hypothetical protein
MKIIIYLIFISSFNALGQKKFSFENENLKINYAKKIDSSKLWVTLSQPNEENITFYNLFQNNKFGEENYNLFPTKSGYYYLSIIYDLKLQYQEIIYYSSNPKTEKLVLTFNKKKNNIYCKMQSSLYKSLNKNVLVAPIDYNKVKEYAKNRVKIH